MENENNTEVTLVGEQATCCQCGKQRTKNCKPWQFCTKCGGVVCLKCAPLASTLANPSKNHPLCNKCWRKQWEEERERQNQTPVECDGCHAQLVIGDSANPYVKSHNPTEPYICKKCHEILTQAKAITNEIERAKKRERRKLNPRGLVEVIYDRPEKLPECGYAYDPAGLSLQIGDVVLVPKTFLDEHGPREATVVSLASDYDGEVRNIIRLVRRVNGK